MHKNLIISILGSIQAFSEKLIAEDIEQFLIQMQNADFLKKQLIQN